eukprot:Mycagemm_TRINITY_DN2505_c0_g1::TRINITY_DN2505_c0_g1_i1::g.4574::m.4574 type:complete len:105 gc:universal TRINITY_DN2505_c0_g1_i1:543-229(-)
MLATELGFSFLQTDLPLCAQVGLAANNCDGYVAVVRILLDLLQPHGHLVECLFCGDVVGEKHRIRATVKGRSNRTEALLATSIPQFNNNAVSVNYKLLPTEIFP